MSHIIQLKYATWDEPSKWFNYNNFVEKMVWTCKEGKMRDNKVYYDIVTIIRQ